MVSESELKLALKKSWTQESSSTPKKWTSHNPACGQCAVTALIVNDYFGGDILWTNAVLPNGKKISHFFNKIEYIEKDFTKIQFPNGTKINTGVPKTKKYSSTREYILSYSTTQIKYKLLKYKVQNVLKE